MVRVALTQDDFSPYQNIDAQGRIGGFSVTGLSAVARALGVRLEPVLFKSWPEVLAAVRERKADLIPYIGYTDERSKYLSFTRGVGLDPSTLIGSIDRQSCRK